MRWKDCSIVEAVVRTVDRVVKEAWASLAGTGAMAVMAAIYSCQRPLALSCHKFI
jgi:hypothetical protein